VLDPDLLVGLPQPVVACSGLDALSHLLEALVSCRANPLTDALGAEGLRRSARALRRAYTSGLQRDTREDLMLASLCGGLCLANGGWAPCTASRRPWRDAARSPWGALRSLLGR